MFVWWRLRNASGRRSYGKSSQNYDLLPILYCDQHIPMFVVYRSTRVVAVGRGRSDYNGQIKILVMIVEKYVDDLVTGCSS
jgi:hypothetical protein